MGSLAAMFRPDFPQCAQHGFKRSAGLLPFFRKLVGNQVDARALRAHYHDTVPEIAEYQRVACLDMVVLSS